ncbi:hypothetical protein HYPSUDRAFT_197059 [Hypholoma sublateritium FD-334 SS-4]|uniref:Uncharacterized protein n=1 Tax=Hypholoma sublateritium (strain FD-334 SS-4) TaxID=945553 RepID=A0A0D2MXU7_HYPSF|nr:hypothetical protein HYPSUDRAFT_197059 [Hypholoma sublateritium FD-334 SS-4]
MSVQNDDKLPASYKYAWTTRSDISLKDFLTKLALVTAWSLLPVVGVSWTTEFKPSMVQNDGSKPWIWVQGSASEQKIAGAEDKAKEEAAKLLKEVTEKVENIKNDDSIPVRSSKKTGAKSKKEVREQVQAEATEQLKKIATKHGYVCGKWLIFAPADKVDMIWSTIATSLVSGPLHSTSAFLAKVSTSSSDENSRGQHIICVYLPDVYDKPAVTQVMKVLLGKHGATLSGVKADLYTTIGIDSKHPSGIPSTIWKNNAVLSEQEAKDLKDSYFSELATRKSNAPSTEEAPVTNAEPQTAVTGTKSEKPTLKKKGPADPFGSDSDRSMKTKEQPEVVTKLDIEAKKLKLKPKLKKKVDDPFGSEEDDVPEKAKPAAVKSKRTQQSDDDDGEDRPKKKRAAGN